MPMGDFVIIFHVEAKGKDTVYNDRNMQCL